MSSLHISTRVPRRRFLRGAGVLLTLPWFEFSIKIAPDPLWGAERVALFGIAAVEALLEPAHALLG